MSSGGSCDTSRIQTLKRYRAKDDNGLARMEYAAEVPGYFHVFITCGIMIYQNHGGTKRGRGLNRDITLLQRLRGKGGEGKAQAQTEDPSTTRDTKSTAPMNNKSAASKSLRSAKGPSWHDLKEVIEHTLEARVLLRWLKYSGCATLDDLRHWKPSPDEWIARTMIQSHGGVGHGRNPPLKEVTR